MKPNQSNSRVILRILNPLALIGGLLLYSLGVGVAIYLGRPISWGIYFLGQGCVTLLQISSAFLRAFYEAPPEGTRRSRPADGAGEGLTRNSLLLIAATALTAGAVLTVLLYSRGALNPTAFLFLAMAFVLAYFYAVPPFQFYRRGYGDLSSAIFLMNLTPALGFSLQTGEVHRLLAMLTFPLTCLYLALMLAVYLQTYYQDVKANNQTLMVRVGWQRGMQLHNWLILIAYFLIGLASVLGLPWSLTWPALITFPLGLFQIFQMWQISNGAPPRWRLLRLTALASLGLLAYMLTFALWVR